MPLLHISGVSPPCCFSSNQVSLTHPFIHYSFVHSFLVLIANLQGLIYGALGAASHKQGPFPNEPTGAIPIILMETHPKKQNLGVLLVMAPESSWGK